MDNYVNKGPLKISPYLLPNLCANLPSGKAGMVLKFSGPIFPRKGPVPRVITHSVWGPE